MGEEHYEQYIDRKKTAAPHIARILAVLIIIALVFFGFQFLNVFILLPAAGIAWLSHYIIVPRLKISYDYILWSGTLEIAAVYDKQKRSELCLVDLSKVILMAPSKSYDQRAYRITKTRNVSSRKNEFPLYDLIVKNERETECITIEPDEKMAELIKPYIGAKLRLP